MALTSEHIKNRIEQAIAMEGANGARLRELRDRRSTIEKVEAPENSRPSVPLDVALRASASTCWWTKDPSLSWTPS